MKDKLIWMSIVLCSQWNLMIYPTLLWNISFHANVKIQYMDMIAPHKQEQEHRLRHSHTTHSTHMWVSHLIVEIQNCLPSMLNMGHYTLYILYTSTPIVMTVSQTGTASLPHYLKHYQPSTTHIMSSLQLITRKRHLEVVSWVIVTSHTGHHDLSVIQPQPHLSSSSKPLWNPFDQQTKFSTHWVLHSDNLPTHTFFSTQGYAPVLSRKDRYHFSSPVQTNQLFVPIPASLFLSLSILLLNNHILNKPAVTLGHQSSDAKPWHTVTMHNPYNNSNSWEQKKA